MTGKRINPVESAKNEISELLTRFNAELSGVIEIPKDRSNGDFSASHALQSAKRLGRRPRDIADELTASLNLEGTYFEKAEAAGPGFINFTLSQIWYREVLEAVEEGGAKYGAVSDGSGKNIMVEFVSANPTGPMTIGNARGGALGDTLAAVLDRAGYNVWREFYVNDSGNQVELFGRSVDARYQEILGLAKPEDFPDNGYHGDDIRDLAQQIINEKGGSLLLLEDDERIKYFINYGIPRNIALMKEHLERYRIRYDRWFHESELISSGYVAETVDMLRDAGLTYEQDGALWLSNKKLGADKDEVLRRSNGYYTYYASDIAYHRDKLERRGFDRVIDVWGADHHGHAVRFRATTDAPVFGDGKGYGPDRLVFLIMQMVRLTRDGETVKVSKRTGKALTLNDLLDEISVDACRFFFNAKPDNHLEFDLGLAVRQDSENPVYYAQYAHARICSLVKAIEGEGHTVPACADIDTGLLTTVPERELIRALANLPEEISASARELDPSRINRYILDLAAKFHKFYTDCRIRGEAENLLLTRLKLADLTRSVLKNCLNLVGVDAPEHM